MNVSRVSFRRLRAVLLIATIACFGAMFCGSAAHAQGTGNLAQSTNAPQASDSFAYTSSMPTANGVTNSNVGGGSEIAQNSLSVNYGQFANIFLARFTPVLVVVGIAGAAMFAAKGGVRMVHGYLRGAFH